VAEKTVKLKVMLEAAGIKPTTKQLKELNKQLTKTKAEVKGVGTGSNKLKRNLEGVSQRAGSTGKDFSRMQQGMGGLVQIYATVAANVFALSSAFLVLRRAADLSSMTKSAEDFSNRFGVSVTRITKQMQEASGGALSFAEALPTINKAISAGIGVEQMEQLTIAATKASQTFGGSATEALNRFISAAQRGRVEIIQTLGIVIKTEQAYKDYAASIGKTALELTALDRQQAILNATIKESQSIFDQVNIDPNPFQQFLTTIIDLKDVGLTLITDFLTPFINTINKSKAAAAALIALLISIVGKRIFPALGDQLVQLQKKSFESTRNAAVELRKVQNQQSSSILQNGIKQNKLTKTQLLQRDKLFKTHFNAVLSQHKSFGKSLLDERKRINAAVLNEQRSAITRELNIRQGTTTGTRSVAFKGISDQALENQRNRLILLTKETENARAAAIKLSIAEKAKARAFRESAAAIKIATAKMRADIIAFRAQITTGFQRSFTLTQTNFITSVRLMGRSWKNFIKFAIISSKGAEFAFAAFGRAVGRTAGLIAGGFIKAISIISSLTLVVSLGALAWEKFGDKIRGITPEMRAVIEAGKELNDALEEVNKRAAEGIARLGSEFPNSLKKLQDALKFTAGTFASINTAIINFRRDVIEQLGGKTVEEAAKRIKELEENTREFYNVTADSQAALDGLNSIDIGYGKIDLAIARNVSHTKEQIRVQKEQEEELKNLKKVMSSLSDVINTELLRSLTLAVTTAKAGGFKQFGTLLVQELNKGIEESGIEINFGEKITLITSALMQDVRTFNSVMDSIKNRIDDDAAFSRFSENITKAIQGFISVAEESTRTIDAALSSLSDVDNRISNFIGGLDKARAATGANKEIVGFVLDINRELQALLKNQKGLTKNDTLAKLFPDPEELQKVKTLLGFAVGQVVTIGQVQTRAAELQKTFVEQAQSRLLSSQKLKILALELNSINSRELKTDSDRIKQLQDRLNTQIEITKQAILAGEANAAAQAEVLRGIARSGGSAQEVAVQQAILDVLIKQNNVLREKQRVQESSTKDAQEVLKIAKEALTLEKKRLGSLQKIQAIDKKLAKTALEGVNAELKIFDLKAKTLKVDRSLLLVEKARINALGLEEDARDRKVAALNTELILNERLTAELEHQLLSSKARKAELTGTSIFSKEGLSLAAEFFIREVQANAKKVASTFETIGRGFSSVIQETFDTAIDNLLEGGKDFAHTVREAFKSGLREIIGKALKNDITRLLGDAGNIFDRFLKRNKPSFTPKDQSAVVSFPKEMGPPAPPKTETAAVKTEIFQSKMVEQALKQTDTQQKSEAYLEAISSKIGECNASESVDSISEIEVKDLERTPLTIGSSPSLEGVITTVGKLGELASKDSGTLISQGLITLGTTLISAILSQQAADATKGVVSTIGSIFPFSTGGMVPGGIKSIVPLATGAVTKGPNLALIGEGKHEEAVVPLPNNREIPVDLKQEAGDTIKIEQNFDFTNANTDTVSALRLEARAIEDRTFNRVFSEIDRGGKYARIVGRR